MTSMPRGWRMRTLGDVAKWSSGGTPKTGTAAYYGGDIPWAIIGDLKDGPVLSTAATITYSGLKNSSAKWVPAGALLVAMYGSIGKLGIATMPLTTNQAIAAAVPDNSQVEAKYLFYYLMAQRHDLNRAGKGAAQQNIGQGVLKAWPIPVAPLNDQRRIVGILEDQLSRLDYCVGSLINATRRLVSLSKSVLFDLIPDADQYPPSWTPATVQTAGNVGLGRQRHPDWHQGPNMRPYLRVANVFEDWIDATDLKTMHWSDGTFERFKLHPGDVLLNEGQSPEYLGRPAIYRGEPPEVAFTNSLIRFKANEGVLPDFALLVFRRHMHAGRFVRESRITTNIAHLSASRLKTVEFPIPPLKEQQRTISMASDRLAASERMRQAIDHALEREKLLRRAFLSAAFSGKLIGTAMQNDHAIEVTDNDHEGIRE